MKSSCSKAVLHPVPQPAVMASAPDRATPPGCNSYKEIAPVSQSAGRGGTVARSASKGSFEESQLALGAGERECENLVTTWSETTSRYSPSSRIRHEGSLFIPKGCQKIAGGRAQRPPPENDPRESPHPGRGARGWASTREISSIPPGWGSRVRHVRWWSLALDHRLFSETPAGVGAPADGGGTSAQH